MRRISIPTKADVLFQSGTLGPTGVSWNDLLSGKLQGSNISKNVFIGARFYLAQPATTTEIGGHFAAPATGDFFGAIVKLSGENDFPDSGDLSTPDVLGTTHLAFPSPSNEVLGSLSLSLDSGWYAVAFGSGLFGTTASGGTVQNGVDIGSPTYIAFQPGAVLGWGNLITPIFRNYCFVVEGHTVPEPNTFILASIALLSLLLPRSWSGVT